VTGEKRVKATACFFRRKRVTQPNRVPQRLFLVDAVKAPGLFLVAEPRPPSGPFASLQWLVPTAVVIWFGKSYFDGFLKEAGKDHYALVKRGLSSLWPWFFGEGRCVCVTAVGSQGKIRPGETNYSLVISILAEAVTGLHFKLLFLDDISAEGSMPQRRVSFTF
jgi:hypothetical protein